MSSRIEPVKDRQTVRPDGSSVKPRIEGLNVRPAPLLEDERGELVEVYRPSWGFHPEPLVYVYHVTLRPGSIRGWVVHRKQDDRIFTSFGTMRWAFFDDRESSPTRGLLNVFTWSERNRALFTIPIGVYHAVQCLGRKDAAFVNMPTRPYDHEDPDKYRLPLRNSLIPFDFSQSTAG